MRPITADKVAYLSESMKAIAMTNDFVTASLGANYTYFQTYSYFDMRIKSQSWNAINTYLMAEPGDSYELIQAISYSPLFIEHLTHRKAIGTLNRVLVFKVYYALK